VTGIRGLTVSRNSVEDALVLINADATWDFVSNLLVELSLHNGCDAVNCGW
jgi:hypothetical protein